MIMGGVFPLLFYFLLPPLLTKSLDNFKEQLNNLLKLNFEAVIPQMNIRR